MSAPVLRYHRGGVHLPEAGLWLDAHQAQVCSERVFVSHAHSDHTAAHREVILTKPTARLMQARIGGERIEHVLPFGQRVEFKGAAGPFQLTLLPAGHIFGSAMALVETDQHALLYTGDFKLRPSFSAETCDPARAKGVGTLIMETTFGRPVYQFPPAADVMRGIARFCREALDNEETPVLLGYSLGKSQELLRGLADAELPIALHSSVFKLTQIYEEFGQTFPAHERFEAENARGKVVICPPNAAGAPLLRKLGPVRTAVLTGWAVDPGCRYRYQVDAAFPLSDHADFPDLVEFVKQVQPAKVYTLHGFAADFAQSLRDLGFDAQALSEEDQLALPLAFSSGKTTRQSRRRSGKGSVVSGPLSVAVELEQSVAPIGSKDHGPRTTDHFVFATFAAICAKIAATPKKLEKVELLAAYLRGLDAPTLRVVAPWFSGHPFAPVLNKPLQLGWALIRDSLCAAADVDQGAFGQVYLKHSDLGETAAEILQRLAPPLPSLSVVAVQEGFERLHTARGPSTKLPVLVELLRCCITLEGKFLVKILTGDLRIGLKEGLVEEAIAQAFAMPLVDVKNANLLLGNIGETAVLAAEKSLGTASLVPFRPLKFMLASPEDTAERIWERVTGWNEKVGAVEGADHALFANAELHAAAQSAPLAWIEDKYDGIRCQLHKVGPRVALYSRDLKDITPTFLDLADALQEGEADFVIDGEIVAMRDERVLPFSELQKRLGRRESDLFLRQEIPIQFIAFDLLWCGGRNLLNEPLHIRRDHLEKMLPSSLRLTQTARVLSSDEVETAFTAARERGNEGLMIKDPAGVYSPGRRGLSWLKLKKAYASLDCVVVGAEYGQGKRKNVLSDYTFAVRDETGGGLKIIGKASSGLTDPEIARLTRHLLSRVRAQEGRYHEVEPDTVLEIAFDSIQSSKRHDSGLAMRFPRIVRIRPDKSLAEIDTLETARKLVRE